MTNTDKMAELFVNEPLIGTYILGVSDQVGKSLESQIGYEKPFDVMTEYMLEFYSELQNQYGASEFKGLYSIVRTEGFNHKRAQDKLRQILDTDRKLADYMLGQAGNVANDLREAGINNNEVLEQVYNNTLASLVLMYESCRR